MYVEQPSIIASLFPSACSGSDTLFAQATIPANCYYELECWNYLPPPGAQNLGWQVPNTNPQQYHNIDLIVNGSLQSNYTMIAGANYTSEDYLIPVTNGQIIDLLFTSLPNISYTLNKTFSFDEEKIVDDAPLTIIEPTIPLAA